MCKEEVDPIEAPLEKIRQQQIDEETSISPQRLPFISVIFDYLSVLKTLFFSIIILVGFAFSIWPLLGIAALFFVLGGLFIINLISWYRFTYAVEDGELRIEQGIIVRKKRHIAINRIHTIDFTSNILHRLLQLTRVQIETASSNEGAEVALSALKMEDAIVLRKVLQNEGKQEEKDEAKETVNQSYPQKKVPWKNLFIAGSTSSSIGVLILLVLSGISQIYEMIPDSVYNQAFAYLMTLSIIFIIVLIVLLVFILWLAGIASTMLKYGHFTIEKRAHEFYIKRGLLETKELTIPFERIQAIKIEQTLIRQPIKYVRVYAIVAGGSGDSSEANPVIFPLLKMNELQTFLETFLPMYTLEANELQANVAKQGKKYYLIRMMSPFILLAIGIGIFLTNWLWIPILLCILSMLLAISQAQLGRVTIDENKLVIQKRVLNRITLLVLKRKIQATEAIQHMVQKQSNIATLSFSTLGLARFKLDHLAKKDIEKIMQWYSYRHDKM